MAPKQAVRQLLRRFGLKRKLRRFDEVLHRCSSKCCWFVLDCTLPLRSCWDAQFTGGQNVDLRQFVMDLPPRLCQSLLQCMAAREAAQEVRVLAHDHTARIIKLQAVCRGWLLRRSRRPAPRKKAGAPLGGGNKVADVADEAAVAESAAVTIQRLMRGALCRAKRGRIEGKELARLQKQVITNRARQSCDAE
jgi:hypothetical protein